MDEQKSTAYLVSPEGKIENGYEYGVFGTIRREREEVQNRIWYTGQQYDRTSNQYYLRARFYSPVVGRFLQEDEYRGDGLNLYAYCGNNPVVYYDPSGYSAKDYSDLEAVFGEGSIEYWAQGYYSEYSGSRQSRLNQTPSGEPKRRVANENRERIGEWSNGRRGESTYYAYNYNSKATTANDIIKSFNQKGITYHNAIPNFRPVSEAVIPISNMTSNRKTNFSQADKELADYLNIHMDSNLYKMVSINNSKITADDISDYRKRNKLTWHEENDLVHMDLLSTEINSTYGHLGGVSEAKIKESGGKYKNVEDTVKGEKC